MKNKLIKGVCVVLAGLLLSCSVFSAGRNASKVYAITGVEEAMLFLIALLAGGAGYTFLNYSSSTHDDFLGDASNIYNDVTGYAQAVQDGKTTSTRATSDDIKAWLGYDVNSYHDGISVAMLNSMSNVFSDFARDRYNAEQYALKISRDTSAALTNVQEKLANGFFPVSEKTMAAMKKSNVILYNSYVSSGVQYEAYMYPSVFDKGYEGSILGFQKAYHSGAKHWYLHVITDSDSSFSESTLGSFSGFTVKYVDGFPEMYSSMSNIFSYPVGSDFLSYSILKGSDFGAYVEGKYLGDTYDSAGGYKALDQDWAYDYSVNAYDPAVDASTVIDFPVATDLAAVIAGLGSLATTDELAAALDKAIADAKAGSIDVPDESTGETTVPPPPAVVDDYLLEDVTEVFPFCIPFDLIDCIRLLDAPAKAPKWEIPFKIANEEYMITIDFERFEFPVRVFRICLTLGFIIGLILLTRNIIRG